MLAPVALPLQRRPQPGRKPFGIVAVRRLSCSTGEIRRLYVHPEARGLGAGLALLEAAKAVARQHGYSRLIVHTLPGPNHTAIGLYGRVGFEPSEHFLLGAPGVTTMSLDLRSAA